MRIFEKSLVLLAVIGVAMNLLLIPGGTFFTMLAVLVLSLFYIFFGFLLFNEIKLVKVFSASSYSAIPKYHILGAFLSGIVISIACIGALFGIEIWAGSKIILLCCVIICLPLLVIVLMKQSAKYKRYYTGILLRLIVTGGLCLLLFAFPEHYLVEIKFRKYPQYIRLLKESGNNPNNEKLRDSLLEERNKMHIY